MGGKYWVTIEVFFFQADTGEGTMGGKCRVTIEAWFFCCFVFQADAGEGTMGGEYRVMIEEFVFVFGGCCSSRRQRGYNKW